MSPLPLLSGWRLVACCETTFAILEDPGFTSELFLTPNSSDTRSTLIRSGMGSFPRDACPTAVGGISERDFLTSVEVRDGVPIGSVVGVTILGVLRPGDWRGVLIYLKII